MGVWARLKRSLRAMFGGIIEKTEDPELILQQTIRDMRDRVPELNNSVAQVMGEDATEVAPPATFCVEDYQAQNQVGGGAVVLGFPFPVPFEFRLQPRQ